MLRIRILLARLAPDPYRETCEVLDKYLSPQEKHPGLDKIDLDKTRNLMYTSCEERG